MGTINTSEFKKGLKVQLDGDPYLMVECNFVKPGKGQALYKCRLKHLIRGTTIDRTWKSGDSIESADVDEISAQYLYRQGDKFVFMDNESYEQYELTAEQVGDTWKYIKESTVCSMMLYNGNPITVTPPNHVILKIEYCEPGARGNTATNVEAVQGRDRGRVPLPLVRRNRPVDQDRHPHRRVSRTREGVNAEE